MKKVLFSVFILIISTTAHSQNKYKVSLIGFYNLENLYDTVNNAMVDDEEFLPNSERRYNSRIYKDKLERLSTVISQMGTDVNPDGLAILG
ncbi:MAG: endonuclease/exonuclease/phosphatase family protein, partial [Chitinophagaceae bacterium]